MTDYPEALVERVAEAARDAFVQHFDKSAVPWKNWSSPDKEPWRAAIRAALDASGLREAVEALSIILSYAEAQPPNAFTQIHQHARAALARIKGEPT